MPLDWVSLLILAVMGFLTFRAYRNGFIRELVSLCTLILAIPIAGIFYDDMFPKVEPLVDNEKLAALISFVAILAGVVIGGQVLGSMLRSVVDALNLGFADRGAGALFGFLKAVVACQVVLTALVVFPSPDLREEIDDSPVATTLLDTAPVVLGFLPGTFDRGVDAFRNAADALNGGPERPEAE